MYFFQWEAPRILTPADRHRLGKYLLDAVPQTADPNMFLSPAWGEVKRSEDPLRDQGSRGSLTQSPASLGSGPVLRSDGVEALGLCPVNGFWWGKRCCRLGRGM